MWQKCLALPLGFICSDCMVNMTIVIPVGFSFSVVLPLCTVTHYSHYK